MWVGDSLVENFEFEAESTPCGATLKGKMTLIPRHVTEEYPNLAILDSLQAESYCGIPLYDSGGALLGSVAIIDDKEMEFDIDQEPALRIFADRAAAELERKRSEEAMKQSYTLLHSVIEGTSDAVFVKDRNGRFLTMNSAGANVFGTSRDRVVGKTNAELIDDGNSKGIVHDDHEVMSTGKTSTYEQTVISNGRKVTYLTTKGPYRDAHGNVMGVFDVARDISEPKQTEKVLRGSEKFHRLLFDKHIDGVVVLRDKHIKYANPVMSKITGYSVKELTGMLPGELMIPEERNLSKLHGSILYFGVPERPLEYTFLRKDGETTLVEIRSRRMEIDDQPTVISFIRDITDQKKNERKLQLTQFAVDKASVAIFWIRKNETFLYVNDAACNSLGYSRAELMEKKLSEIADGFQGIEFIEGWNIARRKQSLIIESQHRREDGSRFPVEVTLNCLKFENDEYLCAYVRDISDRKFAEAAKRESNALLRTIIEGTTDAVYLQDLNGNYLLINPAGAAAMGLSEKMIIGKSDVDLLGAEGAELAKENDSVIQSGKPVTRETCISINGKSRALHINKAPHRNAEGKIVGVIGVCRDVTDLKRTEEKSRQLLSDLAHVGRLSMMGEMASGLAHEINQPLAAISNYAHAAGQLVNQNEPVELEHLQSLLENIGEQSFRAGEIIRHLRVLVKRSEPVRTTVHVRDLLNEVIALTNRELKMSSIRLHTKFPAATAEVEADSIQIQQVIVNLVRNAIDALLDVPPDQRELEIDLIIQEETIEVQVADSGSGIESGETEDIFRTFFTTKPNGMGMGLAISKSIIESHQGQMWNSFASDGRTVIHFRLPTLRNRP